jgi:hypothetical protein
MIVLNPKKTWRNGLSLWIGPWIVENWPKMKFESFCFSERKWKLNIEKYSKRKKRKWIWLKMSLSLLSPLMFEVDFLMSFHLLQNVWKLWNPFEPGGKCRKNHLKRENLFHFPHLLFTFQLGDSVRILSYFPETYCIMIDVTWNRKNSKMTKVPFNGFCLSTSGTSSGLIRAQLYFLSHTCGRNKNNSIF